MHKDYRSSHCWLIELVTIWPVCDNFKANTKLHVIYHGCCVTLERINNAAASSNHLHSKTTYIVTARKWPTRHNFVIHNVLFPGTGRSHNGGDSTHPDVCLVWRQHIALGRHSYHWMFYTRGLLDWQTPEWLFYVDSFQGVLRGRKKAWDPARTWTWSSEFQSDALTEPPGMEQRRYGSMDLSQAWHQLCKTRTCCYNQ